MQTKTSSPVGESPALLRAVAQLCPFRPAAFVVVLVRIRPVIRHSIVLTDRVSRVVPVDRRAAGRQPSEECAPVNAASNCYTPTQEENRTARPNRTRRADALPLAGTRKKHSANPSNNQPLTSGSPQSMDGPACFVEKTGRSYIGTGLGPMIA